MNEWRNDKKWSDQFLTEIKSILGQYLISESSVSDDQERNTDLTVLKLDSVRIGCRIRRLKYLNSYGDEFTIRAGRSTGAKTELTKIIEGWGDYFFYGFGDDKILKKWYLSDLKVFRLWFSQQIYRNKNMPGIQKNNTDNSSNFLSFKWSDFPENFIIAKN